jgi:hypothetical protein
LAVYPLSHAHQAQIDRVIAMHLDGLTNRLITDQLKAEGVLTPRGKIFTTNHVFSMVKKGIRRSKKVGEIGTISNLQIAVVDKSHNPQARKI